MRQKFQIFNSKTIFAPASPASIFFLFAVFSSFFLWSVLLFLFVVLFVSFFRDWIIYKLRQKPVLAATATTTTECSMNLSAATAGLLLWLSSTLALSLPLPLLFATEESAGCAMAKWKQTTSERRQTDNDEDNETRQTNEQIATPSFRVGQSRPVGQLSWHLGAGDKAIKTPTKPRARRSMREREKAKGRRERENTIKLNWLNRHCNLFPIKASP